MRKKMRFESKIKPRLRALVVGGTDVPLLRVNVGML